MKVINPRGLGNDPQIGECVLFLHATGYLTCEVGGSFYFLVSNKAAGHTQDIRRNCQHFITNHYFHSGPEATCQVQGIEGAKSCFSGRNPLLRVSIVFRDDLTAGFRGLYFMLLRKNILKDKIVPIKNRWGVICQALFCWISPVNALFIRGELTRRGTMFYKVLSIFVENELQ